MREINRLVVHSTLTPEYADLGFDYLNQKAKELSVIPQSGVHCIYHYIIRLSGMTEKGRPEYTSSGACGKYNSDSLSVALVGGIDVEGQVSDTFSPEQKRNLIDLYLILQEEYPGLNLVAEKDLPFGVEGSPGFDLKSLLEDYV